MKTLTPLVNIKAFREEKAERAVLAQRRVLEDAETRRDEAEHCLSDFRREATERERRIYRELCSRVVRVHDIDDARAQVLSMRGEETQHKRRLDEADKQREQARRQLDDDREAHALARRTHEKLVELAEGFASEARGLAEFKEEAEIEEAADARWPARGDR